MNNEKLRCRLRRRMQNLPVTLSVNEGSGCKFCHFRDSSLTLRMTFVFPVILRNGSDEESNRNNEILRSAQNDNCFFCHSEER